MKDSQSLVDQLMTPLYNCKFKGSRELTFCLGYRLTPDNKGNLCLDPGKYVE